MSIAFNEAYYLSNNPDVSEAVAAGTVVSAEEHFNLFGWSEGRDPNEHFDTSFYLLENPDVAAAGVNPLAHFWMHGAAEGRVPNTAIDTLLGEPAIGEGDDAFDSATYLAANPDVQTAVDAGLTTAYQHWVLYGQFETREGAQTLSGTDLSGGASDAPLGIGDGDDGGGGVSPIGNTITLLNGASEVLVGGVPVNATNSATDLDDTIQSTVANADASVIIAGDGTDTLTITDNAGGLDVDLTNDAGGADLNMDLTGLEKVIFQNTNGHISIGDAHNGQNIVVEGVNGSLCATTTANGQTIEVENTIGLDFSVITLSDHTGLSVTLGEADDEVYDLQTSDASVSTGRGDDLIIVTGKAAETANINGGSGFDILAVEEDIAADTHYTFTNVSGIEWLGIEEDESNARTVDLFDGLLGLQTLDSIFVGDQTITVRGSAEQWNALTDIDFDNTGAAHTIVLTSAGTVDLTDADIHLDNMGSGGAGGIQLSSGNDTLSLDSHNAEHITEDDGLIDGGDGLDTLIMVDELDEFDALDAVRNIETIVLNGGAQTLVIADQTTASGVSTSIDASALTDSLEFVGIFETDGTLHVTGSNFGDDISLGAGADTAALGNGDDVVRIFEVENDMLVFGGDAIAGFTVGADAISGDAILFSIGDVDAGAATSLTFSTIHGDGANSDIAAAVNRGSVSVLDVAVDAGAIAGAAEHHVINFTDTGASSFSEAIGTGTVNVNNGVALDADTGILVIFYDNDLGSGSAVIGYVDDLGANNLLDSSDTINIIGNLEMSSGDYANFATNSTMFDSF
ncbi:MAG: hypothetical protein ABJJ37_23990 [Roseibium sp.]